MSPIPSNTFFDINHFPRDWGMIVLPISMSRISNLQSPEKYMEYLAFFSEKMLENTVGVNFLYSEGLYMNFGENVSEEKNHLAQNALSHK